MIPHKKLYHSVCIKYDFTLLYYYHINTCSIEIIKNKLEIITLIIFSSSTTGNFKKLNKSIFCRHPLTDVFICVRFGVGVGGSPCKSS